MSNILNELSNLTVISKKLSEVHFKTLTTFCFIALENVKKVDIEYCIDPSLIEYESSVIKNAGYVKFIIYKNNNKKSLGNKKRKQSDRFDDIKNWTQSIFWKDIDVSFLNEKGKRIDVKPSRRAKKISS